MKNTILLLALLLGGFSAIAQDWDHLPPTKSRGPIPADFTEAYVNKYERQRDQISQEQKRKSRQTEDDFYRRSEFFINDFLISGRVLFGDSITQYCEKVVDLLLKDKPDLRSQLRVYTVKSPEVNAFATGNGIIFINLGLLAEVENEAQLAYVLSHEIVHYENKHVLEQYVEEERIKRGTDLFDQRNDDEKLRKLSTYSRTKELEADREGYDRYFLKSGYSLQEALLVMDVLQYSYLPFDEIPFENPFLETEAFKIPESYLTAEVAAITAEDDYDDTRSSHPNIKRRKTEIKNQITSLGGEEYLISKDWFKHCQRVARYESARLYLKRRNYPEAIYSSFLLSKKYGIDRFQRLIVAKALVDASAYRNESDLYKITPSLGDIEGESQQVYHIMDAFEKEDLNTLAVAYSYELLKDHPEDEAVKRIFNLSLDQLFVANQMDSEDFLKKAAEGNSETVDLLDSLVAENRTRSSKIKTIQEKKAEHQEEELDAENYYLGAFVPYFGDTAFTRPFYHHEDLGKARGYRNQRNYGSKNESSKYDKNAALGIDRVVCVAPLYLKLDERAKDGIRYLSTDEQLDKYRQQLLDIADMVDLDLTLLDYKNLSENETGAFNDLGILQGWVSERIAHENSDALVSDFDQVQYLREKYNTDFIAYTGNFSLRVKEESIGGKIIYGIILYPMLPFVLADLVTPEFQSFNFFFLFDLRSGTALLAEYNYYPTADREDYVRSIVYNHLIQIKDKPKN